MKFSAFVLFFTADLSTPQVVKIYIYQVLNSLVYLHSHKITHRDLKPENILKVSEGTESFLKVGEVHSESSWIYQLRKKSLGKLTFHVF